MLFTAKLNAPLGGPYFLTSCVAIDGDTIVAGTGESVAYVYVKPEGGWSDMYPTAILSIGDLENGFECSVAISGNTIIVGDTVNNQYSGAVNVFVKPATGWHDMTLAWQFRSAARPLLWAQRNMPRLAGPMYSLSHRPVGRA